MDKTTDSLKALLALLPERRCALGALESAAEYFSLAPADIRTAAAALPENHDLRYAGVRKLLALCLEEFAGIFSDDGRQRCEVSVPAPSCLIYAAQAAKPGVRFSSSALFAQIALRGIFLSREALDLSSCAKRRCGLNRMRRLLLEEPPAGRPEYLLQFSVLCDECGKLGEQLDPGIKCLNLCFPKKTPGRALALEMLSGWSGRICALTGAEIGRAEETAALALYGRLIKAEAALARLNARDGRRPLKGNSMALAQSALLMSADRAEAFVAALEELARELENAPEAERGRRIYCYFIPFLQPEIDRRFRENGVALVGGGAFLTRPICPAAGLAGAALGWLEAMNIRADTRAECRVLAGDIKKYGCREYLTGAFGFDRWLGAAIPMQRQILEAEYGIHTLLLDVDFWSENAMFGSAESRIDGICALPVGGKSGLDG